MPAAFITVPRRVEIREPELDPEVYADRLLVLAARAPAAIEGIQIAAAVTLRTIAGELRAGRRSVPDAIGLFAYWSALKVGAQATLWTLARRVATDPAALPPAPVMPLPRRASAAVKSP